MKTNEMKCSILLQASLEDLTKLFDDCLTKRLEHFKSELNNQVANDDLMTREQVLELLQINPTTLWNYQNKGRIIVYKLCNKNYYKRSEILESLKPLNK
jgi:hypothetical protein